MPPGIRAFAVESKAGIATSAWGGMAVFFYRLGVAIAEYSD